MKLEKVEFSDHKAEFIITDVEPYQINALRRVLMVDVPKMAIDKVEIHLGAISDEDGRTYESTTPLFDEIISHRLSLVPIPTDLELLTLREMCDCEGAGCPNCQIMYSLNKRGPCTVYSGDLEPLGDEKLRIRDKDIPLVKLTEDQGILIYAYAYLGTGKEHAKWQAAQGVGYRPIPDIIISGKGCDNPEEIVEMCPGRVFDLSKKGLVAKRPEDCSLCMTCVENCENIEVNKESSRYLFRFETDGSLDPKTALMYALDILERQFIGFAEDVGGLR